MSWQGFEGDVTGAWLFTGERLVRGGGVRAAGGRVVRVLAPGEEGSGGAGVLRFRSGLVHPGLVDAHAHLDLSNLSGLLPGDGPFTDWLAGVRALRLGSGREELVRAAEAGLVELAGGGTTAVADFSSEAVSEPALRGWPGRGLLLREVIGIGSARSLPVLEAAAAWLAEHPDQERLRFGLGPHAPYSVHPDLFRGCRDLAAGRPLAIHVAEDPAEALFLAAGGGPFRDFLERLGVSLDGFEPPGERPVPYLGRLGLLGPDTLLVHANDLLADEVAAIGASGAAMVFCPGTHRFFGRPPHPLLRLLDAGVPAGLGTDSAASNQGLSMAAEMRHVRAMFPGLPAETVFALGTGRQLQRFFPGAGSLEEGADADLAVADLGAGRPGNDPLETFLREELPTLFTLAGGRILFDARNRP